MKKGAMTMTQVEELNEIRRKYPKAWGYIMEQLDEKKREGFLEAMTPTLPRFDDNDEMIEEGH
jgi:hypothetical protein